MKHAIEEYFPIVDINRLAVPERNAFKPIYTMHKWFARRSSSVFRAILLGALKPAGTDIMKEFYKDHTNDPDTKGKVILDPFMGGGTTVVEALRLGCKVIGVDLNPVAWFIVKTEVEPVDLQELRAAFDRLAKRTVKWSGKPLKETLLSLYKTECPECGNKDADIIYTFWVKSAPCTSGTCNHYTPLFSDYIISQKKPSLRFYPDCECPKCKNKFDWETDSASLVGNVKLMVNSPMYSAGEGRTNIRWAYSTGPAFSGVVCPWCNEQIMPKLKSTKTKRKKVPLSVIYCPYCEEVWQYRGELSDSIECPSCKHNYNPNEGNIPDKGKFICRGTCGGNVDAVIAAIRTLPDEKLLPLKPYALEGYCSKCFDTVTSLSNKDLFSFSDDEGETEDVDSSAPSNSLLRKNSGKFFKRISSVDSALINCAGELWEKHKQDLPYPKSEIPVGEKTKSGLLAHHYRSWHQMFNARQLLALGTLLEAIDEENSLPIKEMLLSGFLSALEGNNSFCRYTISGGNKSQGIFSRHDYQPKLTNTENNVFGAEYGHGTFANKFELVLEGKSYCYHTYDRMVSKNANGQEQIVTVDNLEKILPHDYESDLRCQSSATIEDIVMNQADCVITDPPYSDNVNYSELADFFYVWLRLVLSKQYSHFKPEYTPKLEEVIENRTRNKSAEDYKNGLQSVFAEVFRISKETSALIFTFHHAEESAWESLIEAVCGSGYYIEAVFPIHSEAESSLHLQDNEAISYDLIHVCRKRENGSISSRKSWATIKQDIRRRARDEARLIESGRYGNEPLTPSDINILLIGKCLELYSKHYGVIVDHEDKPVPLRRALEEIKMLVDQLVAKERQLPTELEDLDRASYVYFTTLCGYKEISSDEMHKNTRGIIEPAELKEKGLIIKGRENRGRSFEVKQPVERMNELKPLFKETVSDQPKLFEDVPTSVLPSGLIFVDAIHFLIGLAELGENVRPWLDKFSGMRPQIRAALDYLISHPKVSFKDSAKKVLNLMDERTLFTR